MPTPRPDDSQGVRVYSEVGVTIAVSENPPQFVKFLFGHERISKNSTQEEIRKTAELIDEFNEAELNRRIEKYQRIVNRDHTAEPKPQGRTGASSVRDRARKRIQ